MSEFLKNNPTALRTCIFYECRRTKNVEEAFKNFCEAIGDDVIDYVDFEYWFYRFYHGNLDFDHERSIDPKPLILTDLPMEMLNEIVGNLDVRNKFNVRKVSRTFEPVVDKVKHQFENFSIYIEEQEMSLHLDKSYVHYEKGKTGFRIKSGSKPNKNHLNIELSDLSNFLTTSKSPIKSFSIWNEYTAFIEMMPTFFESLSKEVCPIFYAKRVELTDDYKDYIIQLLSLFKPGVLEVLSLHGSELGDDIFAELVELDQFKQLKSFNSSELFSFSQFKRLSHLYAFEVRMDHVSAEDIVILRDILSQFVNLKSADISLCNLMNLSEVATGLGIDDDFEQITYSHSIPNSDKWLILKIESYDIFVTVENN